jgi:mono/diheme cytochrome c family protein
MSRFFAVALAALGSAVVWSGSAVLAEQAAPAGAAPTFTKDIAPIFYANCTSCHRPTDIAPMSLLTYKDARPWAKAIAAKVADGTMPPWHADPRYGKFVGERRLTDAQKSTIAKWVAAGAPEGNAADLPAPPAYDEGWNIKPDVVLSMQEDYPIPATGEINYQYLMVPANFAEDRYISEWEIRPGDRRAVHHLLLYLVAPKEVAEAQLKRQQQAMLTRMFGGNNANAANAAPRPVPPFEIACCVQIPAGEEGGRQLPPDQRKDPGPNYRPRPVGMSQTMGGFSPGGSIRHFPEGMGMRIPAGYSLVFQMHYTTYGKASTDRSKIGLKFTKTPPKTVLNTMALLNASLSIPPGEPNYTIDNTMTFNRDTMIYSLVPHTHVRGTGWHYEVTYPDGRKEVILSVPKYDFNWQHEYIFAQPLKLPAGSKLYAKAWYDNSAKNKSNPDATKTVTWGDQTWEEMMYTSITFYNPPPPATSAVQQQQ